MKRLLAGLALAIFTSACQPAVVPEYRDIVDSTFPLVSITGKPYCTGTKIAPNRLLTAAHCVADEKNPMVLRKDGQLKIAKVLKASDENDLALLEVELDGRTAEIQKFEPDTYSEVVAAGFPGGTGLFITVGKWVGPIWDSSYANHMLAAISVGPGNSGGGLWTRAADGSWKLLAVVQAYMPAAQHVCIVSAIPTLKAFLDEAN